MRKEIESDPRAIAWRKLSPTARRELLERLKIKKQPFTQAVRIQQASRQNSFWKLPIPLRTELDGAFDNGRFSRATATRHLQMIRAVAEENERVENAYQNS